MGSGRGHWSSGGEDGGGGVGSTGAGRIFGVGCGWIDGPVVGRCGTIRGGWMKTPIMFCWACCSFYRSICDRLVNWVAITV